MTDKTFLYVLIICFISEHVLSVKLNVVEVLQELLIFESCNKGKMIKIYIANEDRIIKYLAFGIFVSALSLSLIGLLGFNHVTLLNIAAWGIISLRLLLVQGTLQINKLRSKVPVLWLTGGMIGQIHCEIQEHFFDLASAARLFIISIIIMFFYCFEWKFNFDRTSLNRLYRTLFFIGFVSAIYASIKQRNIIKSAFNGDFMSTWLYRAFYSTRNVYAVICVFSFFAAFYFLINKMNVLWLIILVFLFLNVFLTNSRNALLMIFSFLGIYLIMSFSPQNRVFICLFLFIVAILMASIILNSDFLTKFFGGRFVHIYNGEDSTHTRFAWWKHVIEKMINDHAIIFGLGDGYVEDYMWHTFGVGSTHNVYLDVLFKGGILRIGLYISIMIRSFKNILWIGDRKLKNFWISMFVSIICHSIFDSFGTIFSTSYFSFFTTILIVFIPQYLCGQRNISSTNCYVEGNIGNELF